LLYKLQKNRDVRAVKSSNAGVALYEEILTRRKKVYGEIGVEWYDAKRLRKTAQGIFGIELIWQIIRCNRMINASF
jgi:hypothetical protein